MLATLLDRGGGEPLPLPAALAERYGGALRMPVRSVFANFVSTLDGVVSYDAPGSEVAAVVSDGYAGDRFVLALLRTIAHAVVVGAGTLRAETSSVWMPESVFPEAGDAFAGARRALQLPAYAPTVIVTATGNVDLSLGAFQRGLPVVIATTRAGAERFTTLPAGVRVRIVAEAAPLRSRAVVDLAREEGGGERILTEGGPTLLGRFLAERVLDELFLTIAPRLAGRSGAAHRIALVEEAAFDARSSPRGRLISLKAADDYLFTRYAMR